MQDGLIRVAAVSPRLRVADPQYNAGEVIACAQAAAAQGVHVLATPELGITGYTCGDLFGQPTLLSGALQALETICTATKSLAPVLFVGLPLRHAGKLYNCAVALQGGRVLGAVPKTHLPNHAEYYEQRHFAPAPAPGGADVLAGGILQGVPFGTNLLFSCEDMPDLVLCAELCEDLWAPAPPSLRHAAAGATLVVNLSASDEAAGKAARRRSLVKEQSARLVCGYLYADAGQDESSTDLVFSGHNIVAEHGALLAEAPLFSRDMAVSEIDVVRMAGERQRLSTFPPADGTGYRTLFFRLPVSQTPLSRRISPTPFVPEDPALLHEHCETVFSIQAHGLARRLAHTCSRTAVLGISGGLDSTVALLATARAFALLGRPAADITAVAMPGFGSTPRTRANAEALCRELGVPLRTINIAATSRAHFADIGHSETQHDTVYENVQARVRTMVLMNLANQQGGLVVGTGDLSELALGWATYNGDHMSMYGLNASVPKTLLRRMALHEGARLPKLGAVLADIVATPVSPELLPTKDGESHQHTEGIIGPYELHDFFLYHLLRWQTPPKKMLRLAQAAFDKAYTRDEILHWMRVFHSRFFAQQFKRSCLPDGPQTGAVSLSPRGAWRMPSDASAQLWLDEIDKMV